MKIGGKMKRKICVVLRNHSVVTSDWYGVNYDSEILYPDYSEYTKQDYEELQKLLNARGIKENDYERWFVS